MNKQRLSNIHDSINNNEVFGDYERHILTDLLLSMEEIHNCIMFDDDLHRSNEVSGTLDEIMDVFGFC